MADISFWVKSLKVIPQVSENDWASLDSISRWLVASRSAVFIMTALSCSIGGLMAFQYTGNFNAVNFIVCLFGLVFAHAANNLSNDLIDFKRGIDSDNYYRTLYGPQVVEKGYVSVALFYRYIMITLLLAVICGIFLVLRTDIITFYLMTAGIIFLVFYTWPLKYIGLGEATVVLVWGPLMTGGAFYVTSGGIWNWYVIYLSLVYAIGPTSVIFGKHIDKSDKDKEKRVYTIPVILGEKTSRYVIIFAWIVQYLLVFFLISKGVFGLSLLITLLALPKMGQTIRIFLKPKPEKPDPERKTTWPLYFASFAFVYNRRFSLLFLAGLLTDVLLTKIF